MIQRILRIGLLTAAVATTLALGTSGSASAQATPFSPPMVFSSVSTEEKCNPETETHPLDYNGDKDIRSCCPKTYGENPTALQCFFAKYLNPIVNLLAVIVGLVIVAAIIGGGMEIASSAGDSGKYAKGRSRIINAVLSLAGFIFFYAFMQYIVPGGFGT